MNQRRAAGSTGVAYIRWLLRARPADYMLALSVAGVRYRWWVSTSSRSAAVLPSASGAPGTHPISCPRRRRIY